MRERILVAAALSFAALFAATLGPSSVVTAGQAAAQASEESATSILAATREALGGNRQLSAIRTFVASGRTRQIRGDSVVPIEFEIACELPDKYVRTDEVPARQSGRISTGFNGDALIQMPPLASDGAPPTRPAASTPAGAVATSPSGSASTAPAPSDSRKVRVMTLKQQFAALTLGMFATSFRAFPLTFRLAGRAEAPQGSAGVLAVGGPENFAVKFFINRETHLPIMISWTVPAFMANGQGEAPWMFGTSAVREDTYIRAAEIRRRVLGFGNTGEQSAKSVSQDAQPVDCRVYYADYRDVGGGVRFPFRLRRAIGGETVEETNFDGFKINARLDVGRFRALQ